MGEVMTRGARSGKRVLGRGLRWIGTNPRRIGEDVKNFLILKGFVPFAPLEQGF
jgi:hypothetical protein